MRRRPLAAGFRSDTEGAVSIIMAGSLMTLVAAAAFAVDVGSIFLQSRKLQGIADLAAMSAARDIDHATAAAQARVSPG